LTVGWSKAANFNAVSRHIFRTFNNETKVIATKAYDRSIQHGLESAWAYFNADISLCERSSERTRQTTAGAILV